MAPNWADNLTINSSVAHAMGQRRQRLINTPTRKVVPLEAHRGLVSLGAAKLAMAGIHWPVAAC